MKATPDLAHAAAIDLVFASPRRLPKPASLRGRVVVLDVAFAAEGIGSGFEKITGKFLHGLGPRLARWVDHHDHERHAQFRGDARFVLHTKAEHGACPEIITPQMVQETGPVDTIVAHFDLDGLYSAAKWLLGGVEPYPGADADARAVDTRTGEVGPIGALVDKALRAHYEDTVLLIKIVRWLVAGRPRGAEQEAIAAAAADFDAMAAEAAALARAYVVEDGVALVRVPANPRPFDKTELLLLGQQRATIAVVIDGQTLNIAAGFESGLDFVTLLGLGGGMPTRVSVPASRLDDTLVKLRGALRQRG
ncbi:hypothetical protein [Nannocystis bainbridge]|uniref:Uncharacterized protein n=1 Tax=Nannocystis bainbridge TaxID=2995303 RepID=A0ABT5E013_9BACT|nr:hypothetical protein [Nannocystis bainbridge]MDC0719212.1 hypothetical protein [Nannocystis bainbridge]